MQRFLREQHARLGAAGSTADAFVREVLIAQNNGYRDKLEAYELAFAELGETASARVYENDLNEHYGHGAVLFDGVVELLERLSRVASLGLVTNGRQKGQTAKLASAGIAQYFQSVVISESFGAKKPDKSLFHHCLHELDATPAHSVFIGDHPENDLKPAKEIGMKTIWVRNSNYAQPDFIDATVDSVTEIESLFASWT